MQNYIITMDCGTTNTRTILWDKARNMLRTEKREIGVRNTAIDGNNSQLKSAVKSCIDGLLKAQGIGFENIQVIIASGMITSNVGLVEIPHLVVPADMMVLAESVQAVLLEDVCPLPIYFIPGMKNYGGSIDLDNLEAMDIMRGEEVESCAIIEQIHQGEPLLLVLPGSHTKFVSVDAQGKITGCLTSITGELLAAISKHTIIADAVNKGFVNEQDYDKEMLLCGYDIAKKTGLGRTCFSARILNQFVTKDAAKIANFLLGAVLQTDMMAVKNSEAIHVSAATTVVVAGKNPLRAALTDILKYEKYFKEVIDYSPSSEVPLSALGALAIASKKNIL